MTEYNYKGLVNEVVSRGINLAESFDGWTKCAFSLSDLGDEGRPLFHAVAAISPKYRHEENEKKFTNALNTASKVGISTFLYMCQQAGIDTKKYFTSQRDNAVSLHHTSRQEPEPEPSFIPKDYVYRSMSTDNNLMDYLCRYFSAETLFRTAGIYFMGSTRSRDAIFWQVDECKKVRSGKVIAYDKDTGHRNHGTGVKWIHKILNLQNFNLRQCLFGQHLLKVYPDKPICIVESEKTAFVCAMIYPQLNWLSCGGFGNFKAERLQALAGKKVIVYPDTDTTGETFAAWRATANTMTFANFVVSDFCEKNATQEQKEMKADIADLLLAEMAHPDAREAPSTNQTDEEKALAVMVAANPVLNMLINKLNLVTYEPENV